MSRIQAVFPRRVFLNVGFAASLSIPLATLPVSMDVNAAEKPKLDPAMPLATSLGYTHDATKSARASGDDVCRTCLHYHGDSGSGWGGCNIFSGNLVNANGWCNAFSKRG